MHPDEIQSRLASAELASQLAALAPANIPVAGLEIGPWVPADQSGAGLVLVIAGARYFRLGQLVLAQAIITYPVTASGAPAIIGGLPFALDADGSNRNAFIGYQSTVVNPMFCLPDAAGTTLRFYTTGGAPVTNNQLTGASLVLTAIYGRV